VLILGGTAEARELATRLVAIDGVAVLSSLAGATRRPANLPGEMRVGGFGGAAGLERFLRTEAIAALVDATHPFAQQITAQATLACDRAGIAYLRLERPAWRAEPDDRWIEVENLGGTVPLLPDLGRRVLVAAGRSIAECLPEIPGVSWVVRSIDPPARLPAHARWLEARPPFTLAGELGLLRRERIEVILAKASGGEGARAKLLAARRLGLPVLLLRRPATTSGAPQVETVDDALAWIDAIVDCEASRHRPVTPPL
jgi:precorrin-6A/cobalt-precorrin-6A reductase